MSVEVPCRSRASKGVARAFKSERSSLTNCCRAFFQAKAPGMLTALISLHLGQPFQDFHHFKCSKNSFDCRNMIFMVACCSVSQQCHGSRCQCLEGANFFRTMIYFVSATVYGTRGLLGGLLCRHLPQGPAAGQFNPCFLSAKQPGLVAGGSRGGAQEGSHSPRHPDCPCLSLPCLLEGID